MTTIVIDFDERKVYADKRQTACWDGSNRPPGMDFYQPCDGKDKLISYKGMLFTGTGNSNTIAWFIKNYGARIPPVREDDCGTTAVAFTEAGEVIVYEVVKSKFLWLFNVYDWEMVEHCTRAKKGYLTFGSGHEYAAILMETTGSGDLAMKAASLHDKYTSSDYDVVEF